MQYSIDIIELYNTIYIILYVVLYCHLRKPCKWFPSCQVRRCHRWVESCRIRVPLGQPNRPNMLRHAATKRHEAPLSATKFQPWTFLVQVQGLHGHGDEGRVIRRQHFLSTASKKGGQAWPSMAKLSAYICLCLFQSASMPSMPWCS